MNSSSFFLILPWKQYYQKQLFEWASNYLEFKCQLLTNYCNLTVRIIFFQPMMEKLIDIPKIFKGCCEFEDGQFHCKSIQKFLQEIKFFLSCLNVLNWRRKFFSLIYFSARNIWFSSWSNVLLFLYWKFWE